MPKILYIEDELTKNISSLRKLFAPIINDRKVMKQLADLEFSEPLYPEDILKALHPIKSLDICYEFPKAIDKIVNHHGDYELIIIDRNLSLYEYSECEESIVTNLQLLGITNPKDKITDYFEREGDLLLLILLRIDTKNKDKVFFLTANTKDTIRNSSELSTMIDVTNFSMERIIEKSTEFESAISKAIADLPGFVIQNKYRIQCDILRKHLSEKDLSEFIDMIKHYNNDSTKEFVFFLRKLIDNLLHHIAYLIEEPNAGYWNPKNKKHLQVKPFIKGYFDDKQKILIGGLPAYDNKHHIGYNSIIKNACLSISEITSDCGVHELSKSIDIESLGTEHVTRYTKASLLNQICDVILWYDTAIEKIKLA